MEIRCYCDNPMIYPVEWAMASETRMHPQEVHNLMCTWEQFADRELDNSTATIDRDEWFKNAGC